MPTGKKLLLALLISPAAACLLFLLWKYPPGEGTFWPPCLFHKITGLYCPGCGNTRALYALLHGDLKGSLSKNLLLLPSVAVIILFAFFPKSASEKAGYAIAICYVVFFILRNIPAEPFVWLAP